MDIFIARQPIFDRRLRVYAYELLYRAGGQTAFVEGTEANMATSSVIINSFYNIGLDNLSGGKKVFVNFTKELLNREVATLFPNEMLVVEVLEDIEPEPDVVESVMQLKQSGYTVALDSFLYGSKYEPFIKLANIIKFDLFATPLDSIEGVVKELRARNIQCLAKKVEDHDTFVRALEMGFNYFQGFFFAKPDIVAGHDVSPLSLNCVRLAREANKRELNFQAMARIITRDASLTYKLLKLINTVGFGYRYRIKNVLHALVCLGAVEARKWVTLLSMMGVSANKTDELLKLSFVRARFLESVAPHIGMRDHAEPLFMLGLFSMMETMMGRTFDSIFEGINIAEDVKLALINGKGHYARPFRLMLAYEKGDWDTVNAICAVTNIRPESVLNCYLYALDWCGRVFAPEGEQAGE